MTKKEMGSESAEQTDESGEERKGTAISSLLKWRSEEHVAYKAFNFFFYGALQTFNSYVSVYLKTRGLSAGQVGLINGTHPIVQVIGAPLAGILGDKYKIKKQLLLLGIIVMTIRTMLYLAFQPHKQTCQIFNKTQQKVISTSHIHYRITKRSSGFVSGDGTTPVVQSWAEGQNIALDLSKKANLKTDEKEAQGPGVLSELPTNDTIIEYSVEDELIFVKIKDKDEIREIFIILLCLTMFGEIFEAFVSTIADTCSLDYLGENREKFGLFRFWGALGSSITSPLCGVIFDHFAVEICGQRVSAYHIVFFFYFGYMCTAFLITTHFQYRYDTSEPPPVTRHIKNAFLNLRYGTFLLASLYMGLCYGFLTSFSFWFLDDLGASATMLGIASSARSVSENCVYLFSPIVLRYLGHVKVASGCLLAFALSFLSYSFVWNPWVAIPLEILYTAAYAFAWVTCVSYLNKGSPPGSSTMIQGVIQASFWGLGFGNGSIIGGIAFGIFGNRKTFIGFSISSFVMFLFFVLIQLILLSVDDKVDEEKTYNALDSSEGENEDNVKK